jgi:hypothetical protein
MSPTAQAKILRAIEYGEFEKLGSETLQRADVRVVSATHWPLGRFVASERFRKDLFDRVSGITLAIPPLRDRPSDLGALIASEITLASQKEGKTVTGLDRRAAARSNSLRPTLCGLRGPLLIVWTAWRCCRPPSGSTITRLPSLPHPCRRRSVDPWVVPSRTEPYFNGCARRPIVITRIGRS